MEKILERYAKENNIKGYLSYMLDYEKIIDSMSKKELEKYKGYDQNDYFETILNQYIDLYNYNLAKENEDIQMLQEFIEGCEFDIMINKDGTLDLKDLQYAYLGGVDTYEGFEDIESASGRLEGSFYNDYYFSEI